MTTCAAADLKKLVEGVKANSSYVCPQAFGVGLATVNADGQMLDTYFSRPYYQSNFDVGALLAHFLGYTHGTHSYQVTTTLLDEVLTVLVADSGQNQASIEVLQQVRHVLQSQHVPSKVAVVAFIAPDEQDEGPKQVPDAYLRLHLLSHRLIKPHGIKLDGIFGVLPNVAWTSHGPISMKDLPERQHQAMLLGQYLMVHSVDKFPRMVDYVVPSGVRIADASRVRLGAYLGEGTTVMHEGFINFNAGCEGPNMIEGRVSAGVFVKKGSDLGGGCSTMGTLSGGGNVVISIGENCLIGANAGAGIPLGNRCTIEAGLYVTAGTKVLFEGQVIKARDLAGRDNILFRRNSQTGQVEAISKENTVELNALLH